MQGRHDQSASQTEWSAFLAAIDQVKKDMAAYDRRVALGETDVSQQDLDFNHSAPQFHHLDDANEFIQRLWSVCANLSDQQQLIRDRIEKDSSNSSRPPSSDSIATKVDRYNTNHEHYIPTGKKQGAQIGHKGHGRHLKPSAEVDEVIICPVPEHCPACQSKLIEHQVSRRKQVAYLKDKFLLIKEFQILQARCCACHRLCYGELPPETPKGSLGSCVLSIISMLTGRYRLSKRQVKACLYDLFGLKLSVGTISNAEKEVSAAIKPIVSEVHQALKASFLNHSDETTHYHKHQLRWLWLLANDRLAYLCIHRYRNSEIAHCLLGESGSSIWVTDRYSVYYFLPQKQHQYCWAHLKRDIQEIMDNPDKVHARLGRRLDKIRLAIFKEYKDWQEYHSNQLLSVKMKQHLKAFRKALWAGLKLKGQKTANFCRHLLKNWRKCWNFLGNPKIPPTNNHAERMLRHNVIWRKLSLGTHSDRGDRYVERISTVQLSCHLQGRDLLSFLESALNCFWSGHDPPSLLLS